MACPLYPINVYISPSVAGGNNVGIKGSKSLIKNNWKILSALTLGKFDKKCRWKPTQRQIMWVTFANAMGWVWRDQYWYIFDLVKA